MLTNLNFETTGSLIPIMNAAGTVKTIDDVRHIATKSEIGVVLIGSYTLKAQDGNSHLGETYYYDPEQRVSLNSIGLTNGGLPYLEEHLEEMAAICKKNNKLLGVSISEKNIEAYREIAEFAAQYVNYVEINTACGNVLYQHTNRSMPLSCYEIDFMKELIKSIDGWKINDTVVIAIKVGTYPNFCDIEELALEIKNSEHVDFVVTTNTIKTKILGSDGKPVIAPDNGFGGLGGAPLLPIGLGQVSKWHECLGEDVHIIGVGGIFTGVDMKRYIDHGASAVQVGTAFMKNGGYDYAIFSEILAEISSF